MDAQMYDLLLDREYSGFMQYKSARIRRRSWVVDGNGAIGGLYVRKEELPEPAPRWLRATVEGEVEIDEAYPLILDKEYGSFWHYRSAAASEGEWAVDENGPISGLYIKKRELPDLTPERLLISIR